MLFCHLEDQEKYQLKNSHLAPREVLKASQRSRCFVSLKYLIHSTSESLVVTRKVGLVFLD